LKLKAALFVMMGALLLAGSVPSGQKGTGQSDAEKAKCIAKCKNSCQKTYESCKKNATTKTAIQSCQKSLDTCNANCANKACE
jgi:hypothetical protein